MIFEMGFAQEKNKTVYPYGGVPDSSRYNPWGSSPLSLYNPWRGRIPLNFKTADFRNAKFDSLAFFRKAQFDDLASFGGAQFNSMAIFAGIRFDSRADFLHARFYNEVHFLGTTFDGLALFDGVRFDNKADFKHALFYSMADFRGAKFDSWADFRDADIDSIVDFSLAEIKNNVLVGKEKSSKLQKYDFMRAMLLEDGVDSVKADSIKGIPERIFKCPGAKIILYVPVDLKIQLEKFKFLVLCATLDYYSKKDIISTLKKISFKGSEYQKERFELDYIFDRSTMY